MAGYSKRSLQDKLGLKAGNRMIVLNAPDDYTRLLGVLPTSAVVAKQLHGEFDFIHFFTKRLSELQKQMPKLKMALKKTGLLWVSWPKGNAKVATDVNENVVREVALKNGLVDVKVCAVDDTWSGLKLVYRLTDR